MPDFTYRDEGSLLLLTPHTVGAQEWARDFLPVDALTWGTSIVVEPRYLMNILVGIRDAGLSVEEA